MDFGHYILVDRKPVKVPLLEWAGWLDSKDRRVALDKISFLDEDGERHVQISTVFLGLDHNFSNEGPPILFETMIFGGNSDGFQNRYSTWEEAEEGHKKAIIEIFKDALEQRDWKLIEALKTNFDFLKE